MAAARNAKRVKEASLVSANARARAVSALFVSITPANSAWYKPPFCWPKAGAVRPCQIETMLSCLRMQTGVSLLPLLFTFRLPGCEWVWNVASGLLPCDRMRTCCFDIASCTKRRHHLFFDTTHARNRSHPSRYSQKQRHT